MVILIHFALQALQAQHLRSAVSLVLVGTLGTHGVAVLSSDYYLHPGLCGVPSSVRFHCTSAVEQYNSEWFYFKVR